MMKLVKAPAVNEPDLDLHARVGQQADDRERRAEIDQR